MILLSTFAAIAKSPRRSSEPDTAQAGLFPTRGVWNLSLSNVLTAGPAFSGSRGYFPIEGGRLAAYELATGHLEWIVSVRPTSRPAVGNDLVFLAEPRSLMALSEETGKVQWQLPISEEIAVPLVWDNEWLMAATSSGTLLAFRAADGGLIWRRDIPSGFHAAPALAADRVYVPASDNRIVALRVDTGEQLWERRIGGAPNDILALDDRIYVGSLDNYFYCIRALDGEILWRWMTGGDVVGLPVADERRVYFVSLDNVLRGLDRRTGAQRWKRALPLRPTRGPVRVGDLVVVSGISSNALAYRMRDGSPAGELSGSGELAAAPHVVSGSPLPMVVLVTRDLASGTTVRALIRSFDPPTTQIAPLPTPGSRGAPRTLPPQRPR